MTQNRKNVTSNYTFISTNLNIIMESNGTEVKKDAPVEVKTTPVAVKAGAPVAGVLKPKIEEPTNMGGTAAAAPAESAPDPTETPEAKAAREKAETDAKPKTVELNEDQLREYFKGQGIEFTSIDEIKQKLTAPASTAAEPTEEEKKVAAIQLETRMLNQFIADGGTVEQYAALKSVSTMDVKELSKKSTITELQEAGFDDKKIDEIIKERYYVIDLESIKRDENNETEEEFKERKALLQKKVEFFNKKLEGKAAYVKTNAELHLNSLKAKIEAQDLQKANETKFLSSVDKSLKELSRTIKLDLGKVDDKEIDPVQFPVTDAHIAAVKDILVDPAKRKQYFLNDNVSLIDPAKAIQFLLRDVALDSMVKATFLEGGTRQVKEFQKRFPNDPSKIGVGGQTKQNANTGKIASAGAPVRVKQS